MGDEAGDFRLLSKWGTLRTACHDCRGVTTVTEQLESEQYLTRTMVVPGDGTLTRAIAAASEGGESVTMQPCPTCGDSECTGWSDGFVPPV